MPGGTISIPTISKLLQIWFYICLECVITTCFSFCLRFIQSDNSKHLFHVNWESAGAISLVWETLSLVYIFGIIEQNELKPIKYFSIYPIFKIKEIGKFKQTNNYDSSSCILRVFTSTQVLNGNISTTRWRIIAISASSFAASESGQREDRVVGSRRSLIYLFSVNYITLM